jgi:beta-mannanase
MKGLEQFEQETNKKVAIVHWYQDWSGEAALDLNAIRAIAARGSISMITWEPWDHKLGKDQPAYRLAEIIKGSYDDHIRMWAHGLAVYGEPVMLRFAHEMNGRWYPWCINQLGNTSADYIDAWRHIHDIFRQEGATNVQWIWSPYVVEGPEMAFEPLFPGDDYVDWVALDGYNNIAWEQWQTFDQLFGPSYERITRLSAKPVMIAEVGTTEGLDSSDKANWIADAYDQAIPSRPRIKAVVWFNQNKEADWRISSSVQAGQAYQNSISSSYYVGTYSFR